MHGWMDAWMDGSMDEPMYIVHQGINFQNLNLPPLKNEGTISIATMEKFTVILSSESYCIVAMEVSN